MSHVRIEWEKDGAIRTIVLDRPEKRNALLPEMFDQLIAAFETEPPATERATLIVGRGRVFCAGVDLTERIRNGWPQQSPLVRLCEAMRNYPLPVVAALNGDAIAGGCMLTMHCDLILAVEGARLGMPLSQLGIAPPWILTSRTIDRVGPALGREMVLLGHPVSVERLAAANAINAVVPRDRFDREVDAVISQLAINAPLSLRAVKASLASIGAAGVETPHPEEDALVRRALDSEDSKEGMSARLERRTPVFHGR